MRLPIKNPQSKIKNRDLIVFITALLFTAVRAHPVVPAELLTPQLESESINLSRLADGQLSYFDDQRRLTVGSTADFVRLSLNRPAGSVADGFDVSARGPAPSSLMVELTGGQRLVGRWAGSARDGEAVVWSHPTLGRFTLGLDEIRRVVRRKPPESLTSWDSKELPADADAGRAEGDTLTLNNGDRLVGFVIAVGDASVTIQPDGVDEGVTLPIANASQLTLANPPSSASVAGDLIALTDGSRVRATGVGIVGETLTMTPTLSDAGRPIDRPLAELRRLDFAASGYRLVELAALPRTYEAQTAFGRAVRPTVRDGALRLRAPMTVRFALPAGVERFSARVDLDLPAGLPADRAVWANVGLSVAWGPQGRNEAPPRWVLTRDQSSVPINLPSTADLSLPPNAGDLVLTVDPAANGPVLDRLRI
ncbi:MAG: hypothetical protein AAGL98_09605, partial [Planctomycetota bacterium]